MSLTTSSHGQAEATAAREKRQVYEAVRESDWLLVVLPIVSIALWVLGLAGAEPRDMNSLGLLSLLGPASVRPQQTKE